MALLAVLVSRALLSQVTGGLQQQGFSCFLRMDIHVEQCEHDVGAADHTVWTLNRRDGTWAEYTRTNCYPPAHGAQKVPGVRDPVLTDASADQCKVQCNEAQQCTGFVLSRDANNLPPPPCQLEPHTLADTHAVVHDYGDEPTTKFCNQRHVCACPQPSVANTCPCVVPARKSCSVDCDKGYTSRGKNMLTCEPRDGVPIPTLHIEVDCTTPCDQKSYKDTVGNGECTACPTGRGTEMTGATSRDNCTVCGAGESGNPCTECSVGRWKEEVGAGQCSPCSPGSTTSVVGATSKLDCNVCLPGYGASSTIGRCTKCVEGKYRGGLGTGSWTGPGKACQACSSNTTTPLSGSTSASNCTECANGYEGRPCRPKRCPGTDFPHSGHNGCPAKHFGDECKLECKNGYSKQSGSGRYICNATGVWEPVGGELACGKIRTEDCPDDWVRRNSDCEIVAIAGFTSSEHHQRSLDWGRGVEMFTEHVNTQGGLRMGRVNSRDQIGYVTAEMKHLASEDPLKYRQKYLDLCKDPGVDVLLGPPDDDIALSVLQWLNDNSCDKLFLLGSAGLDSLFEQNFAHAWSVFGRASIRAASVVDFLDGLLDARPKQSNTVVIVGEDKGLTQVWISALKEAIGRPEHADLTVVSRDEPLLPYSEIPHLIKDISKNEPNIFIGLGDVMEMMLREFKACKLAPEVAFLAEGLYMTPAIEADSYRQSDCTSCWVYDQWIGTVPWSPEMSHKGQTNWSKYPDKYGDSGAGLNGNDRRIERYMGGASQFATLAREYLKKKFPTEPSEPSYHFTHGVATLLMMQTALELAPSTDGFGLTFSQLRLDPDHKNLTRAAFEALDIETFWGGIKLNASGFNTHFEMGIAQLQDDRAVPRLVAPADLDPSIKPTFPAAWPCELTHTCPVPSPPPTTSLLDVPWWMAIIAVGGIAVICLLAIRACLPCGKFDDTRSLATNSVKRARCDDWVENDASNFSVFSGAESSLPVDPDVAAQENNDAHSCRRHQLCAAFVKSFALLPETFADGKDICFCTSCQERHCTSAAEPGLIGGGKRLGRNGKLEKAPYALPIGWCGFALGIDQVEFARARMHYEGGDGTPESSIDNSWAVSFHGTTVEKAKMILNPNAVQRGKDTERWQLLMPGERTAPTVENPDGVEITIRGGHIPKPFKRTNAYTQKQEWFDPNQVFTSPSIKYCAYEIQGYPPFYCDWTTFNGKRFQVAFQLRQRPGTFDIGQQTLPGVDEKIDEYFENSELEYYTNEKKVGCHKLYRLLVRIHPDDDDCDLPTEPEPEPELEPEPKRSRHRTVRKNGLDSRLLKHARQGSNRMTA